MNKWMRDHKKILIILFFPYLLLLFLLVTPTKFALVGPGGLTPVDENVEIEMTEMSKKFLYDLCCILSSNDTFSKRLLLNCLSVLQFLK